MIRLRTITLSLTAVTLSACAHHSFQAAEVSRQETSPIGLTASNAAKDHQNQRMAQLDSEIFHLSSAFAANEISEESFAARLAAIEAERAGLEEITAELAPAPMRKQDSHSARSTVSLL